MPKIAEREILDVIRAIEAGEIAVTKSDPWDHEGNDCPVFTTSNGWRFVVFNDVGQWDYLESITAPDGREVCPLDFGIDMPLVDDYFPKSIAALKRWGFDDEEARVCVEATLPESPPRPQA